VLFGLKFNPFGQDIQFIEEILQLRQLEEQGEQIPLLFTKNPVLQVEHFELNPQI